MSKKIKYLKNKTKNNIKKYFKKIIEIINRPEMSILPGQLAFYMILSAVPIITLFFEGISIFNVSIESVAEVLNQTIPGGIELLRPMLDGTVLDIKLIIILIWMFYIASNGFNSIILISNQIYGISQSNWIKRRIKAIFMTFSFVVMLLIFLVVPVFGLKIVSLIFSESIYNNINIIYGYVGGPITWLVMFIFIRTIYEFAPDRVRRKNHVNTGALFTSFGWIIITMIYSHLANNMTNYNLLYGTLSSIVFLMMWLYFMSFIFIIGLSLNYGEEIDKEIVDKNNIEDESEKIILEDRFFVK